MSTAVAIVGAGPVSAALAELLRGTEGGDLQLALATDRATDDHLAQVLGDSGVAVLDLPQGESPELVRALGARNVRVVDLGPDLRLAQVRCGFDDTYAEGQRLVALPSSAAMAALCAAGALVESGLLFADRLLMTVVEGGAGSLTLATTEARVADEVGWVLEQRGGRRRRRVGVVVRTPGEGMMVLVQGEPGSEDSQDVELLRRTQLYGPAWLRACAHPDVARVKGSGIAEVAASSDAFSEWVVASCAIDPVWFSAHAALRAARAVAGQAPARC
jgi:hypothetical protein